MLIAGCATRGDDLGDIPLMWDGRHAKLHVFSPDGREVPPFEDLYIQLTGYSFSSAGIGVLPGEHHVRYHCPEPESEIAVNDYIPTIIFRFEAGKEYDLRCVNGSPKITERIIVGK